MAGRKRVYAMPMSKSTRPYKKRKFNKRRKGRRSSTNTSKATSGRSFGYRNNKVSRKVYKNRLWLATSAKTKYRSVMSRVTTMTAPVGGETQVNSILNGLKNVANDFFWTTNGGRVSTEDTVGLSFENASITIRGGIIKLTCCNDNAGADAMVVRVWLTQAHRTTINGSGWVGVKPTGFDPTMVLENKTDLGNIVMYKEFMLENNSICEVTYRLSLKEIDYLSFNSGNQGFFWLTSVYCPSAIGGNVVVTNSYNLSFVGDIIA